MTDEAVVPIVTKRSNMPEVSKNTCIVGTPEAQEQPSCMEEYTKAIEVPVTTRASIPKLPCNADK